MTGFCKNCGKKILVQIFRGEAYCGDNCRKELEKKLEAVGAFKAYNNGEMNGNPS